MRFNVGIKGKGYCFVDIPDLTYEQYMNDPDNKIHEQIMAAIKEKYGTRCIGYAPSEKE